MREDLEKMARAYTIFIAFCLAILIAFLAREYKTPNTAQTETEITELVEEPVNEN